MIPYLQCACVLCVVVFSFLFLKIHFIAIFHPVYVLLFIIVFLKI